MSADHALQLAIRDRLAAAPAVTAHVPAGNIRDSNARTDLDPCIILGEGQSIDDGRIDRTVQRVFLTLHIWKIEPGLAGAKAIAAAVRTAIHAARPVLTAPYQCGDCFVSDMRFLRDPDGVTAHGVVTVEAMVSGG